MKVIRNLLIALAILLVLLGAVVIIGGFGATKPRFVKGSAAPAEPLKFTYYDWHAAVPFVDERMFAWTVGASSHLYEFDLRSRRFLGELINCDIPLLSTRDRSVFLLRGRDSPPRSLQSIGTMAINGVLKLFGKPPLQLPYRTETLWILNRNKNSATKVGLIDQWTGTGSRWVPSPDLDRGYTEPTPLLGTALYLCDLKAGSLERIPLSGYPVGWWNNRELLIDNNNNRFDLFNVESRTRSPLLSPNDTAAFLKSANITNAAATISARAVWNGAGFDFYFALKDKIGGLSPGKSFLARYNRAEKRLQMLDPNFQFHWSGQFNTNFTLYLYPGELGKPGSAGNGAVHLLNLADGKTTELVPPDNAGQYSLPQFHGDEVIFTKKRRLWRVGLDGQNLAPLFPIAAPPQ